MIPPRLGPRRPGGRRGGKPAAFDLFTEAIEQVTGLFLTLAKLPAREHRG